LASGAKGGGINKIYAHVPKQNIWKMGKVQNGFSGDNSFTYYIGNHPCHFSINCPSKAIILQKKNPNQKLASIPSEKKFKDVTINTMMAITT
jgi:hypothetical protein